MKINKYMVFTIIGIIVYSSLIVTATNVITANQVGFTSSKTNKTNIQDAIDELYTKANKIAIDIKSKVPGATVITDNLPTGTTGVKAIVYMDPTNLSTSCNASNSVSTTGTKTGCMKWYVYAEYDRGYNMILDHNSEYVMTYNKNGNASPDTLQPYLDKLVSENGWKVTPRLITAQEIANITGNTIWAPSGSEYYFDTSCSTIGACGIGKNKYAWLFSYSQATYTASGPVSCTAYGCNVGYIGSYGYWTSTAYTGNSSDVWCVIGSGILKYSTASSPNYGIRPVITILK